MYLLTFPGSCAPWYMVLYMFTTHCKLCTCMRKTTHGWFVRMTSPLLSLETARQATRKKTEHFGKVTTVATCVIETYDIVMTRTPKVTTYDQLTSAEAESLLVRNLWPCYVNQSRDWRPCYDNQSRQLGPCYDNQSSQLRPCYVNQSCQLDLCYDSQSRQWQPCYYLQSPKLRPASVTATAILYP